MNNESVTGKWENIFYVLLLYDLLVSPASAFQILCFVVFSLICYSSVNQYKAEFCFFFFPAKIKPHLQ